ncbi:MAG: class I SAM-dependent methyltransferase, partial [Planctomycetota bacterium]|nr:class I SAM-dependent methyltransferase [Planctomycetota bacterium]
MTGVYDEADLYCAAFDFPVNAEVEWLLQQIPGVKRILEPMCGNARYGHAFIKHGIEYVGLDASPSMLARAEVRAGMNLHEVDCRAFSLEGEPFDLAFCPIDSIRHVSGEGDI